MIILLIAGGVILAFIVLAVLDHFNMTHIFMKGRSSGSVGSAMRAMQDALEPGASKAHEYIIEQKEEKDKSQDKTESKE